MMRRLVFGVFLAAVSIWLLVSLFGPFGESQLAGLNVYLDRFEQLRQRMPILIYFSYGLVVFLSAMIGLPPPGLLTVAGAAVLGFLPAIAISLPATIAGAVIPFTAARHLLRPVVSRRFAKQAKSMQRGLESDGPWYLFSLRLVPLVPFPIVNLIMGVTTISLCAFTTVSFVGRIPLTLLYGNAGIQLSNIQSTADIFTPQVTLSLAALAIFPHVVRLMLEKRLKHASRIEAS